MKVYVDELPKSCIGCCFECSAFCCINNNYVIDDYFKKTKNKDCPIQSLSDHDKQVRKEVCEEIRKEIFEYLKVNSMEELEDLSLLDSTLTYDVITDKLDQIQGEDKNG